MSSGNPSSTQAQSHGESLRYAACSGNTKAGGLRTCGYSPAMGCRCCRPGCAQPEGSRYHADRGAREALSKLMVTDPWPNCSEVPRDRRGC